MSQRGSQDGEQSGEQAATAARDFAAAPSNPANEAAPVPPSTSTRPPVHIRYDLRIDNATEAASGSVAGSSSDTRLPLPSTKNLARSDTVAFSPVLRRRNTRAPTFKTVEDFEDFDVRAGWHPGAEPGVDPDKPDGGHASMPTLQVPCDITVFDFSQDDMVMHHLDNGTLAGFLQQPQPSWVKCRWISVNGLSWDVIQALGQYKKLHKLAIEDIMNARNRTKADYYANHAFFIFTLQKLVHLNNKDDSSDSDSDSDSDANSFKTSSTHMARRQTMRSMKKQKDGVFKRLRRWFGRSKDDAAVSSLENGKMSAAAAAAGGAGSVYGKSHGGLTQPLDIHDRAMPRTLQGYHSNNDNVRTAFMEKLSVLSEKNLTVTAEQVSVFITHDNTIISFIEQSSEDVEGPILARLSTADTILRQSCDASMVAQAIMDAVVDLAIPVAACYSEVIGDLELDVLTRPNLTHTKKVYITIVEINQMLSLIQPIISLVNSLRDHKTDMPQDLAAQHLQNPAKGVVITPMTHTYLGDVLDHCVLITDSLTHLKGQAEGMIDLIFNTVTAYQNENLKQLTLMSIIFLPLTFITGYFGQNFEPFDVLKYDVQYFWTIACPVVAVLVLFLMRDIIWESVNSLLQQRHVVELRKHRKRKRQHQAKAKAKAMANKGRDF